MQFVMVFRVHHLDGAKPVDTNTSENRQTPDQLPPSYLNLSPRRLDDGAQVAAAMDLCFDFANFVLDDVRAIDFLIFKL